MANIVLVEDESRRKAVEYKNNKIVLEAKDPYGLWEIFMERGVTPKELKGQFTEPDYAIMAINTYLNKQELNDKANTKEV